MARQADLRREEGNACFRKARLGAAIDCYTEASTTALPPPSPDPRLPDSAFESRDERTNQLID